MVSALRRCGPALFLLFFAVPVLAQSTWNSPRTLALVRTAIQRRFAQLSDTGLVDYRATAHGYVTFLVQLGTGFPTPPKIVRADQLAVEVYWRSPDLSKQRIIGRRDTTLLPTDILYHRDHLGIVQNNFPNIIRIGEGDEVRDAPHPLSPAGLSLYDFAIADSLRITLPGKTIDVYEVKVRPKDPTQPRVVGAVYLDRHTGQVVRMALSFTRAALIDPSLEDISVVLENGLIDGKYWLPRHQELEIRRTGTWLDYPVRGIIRGRWEVSDYKINEAMPIQTFAGPRYQQAPPSVLKAYAWHGNILDSLPPDVAVATDADVRRVQAEARELVREQALRRVKETRLSVHSLSDFASVNRVQGLTLGAGVDRRLVGGLSANAYPQYGIDDHTLRGSAGFTWSSPTGMSVRLYAEHVLAEARDEPERSRAANSLAAQEFGSDATEPYDLRAVGLALTTTAAGLRWTVGAAGEQERAVSVHAKPALGHFAPTIAADRYDPLHLSLRMDRDAPLSVASLTATWSLRLDWLHYSHSYVCPGLALCTFPGRTVRRAVALLDLSRNFGPLEIAGHTHAAIAQAAGGYVPVQHLAYFGGPITAPGYPLHGLVGTQGISQRVELRFPIPFYAIPLGDFGRSASRATLAPYFNVVALDPPAGRPALGGIPPGQRVFPSVGVGLIGFFDLVRLDVARGLRGSGRWTFSLDATRAFWDIL